MAEKWRVEDICSKFSPYSLGCGYEGISHLTGVAAVWLDDSKWILAVFQHQIKWMSNLHNKEFEKGVVWVEKGLDVDSLVVKGNLSL